MTETSPIQPLRPFRVAVLRGLAILMPPLLTIVLFIWAWSVIESYILIPSETVAAKALVWVFRDSREQPPSDPEEEKLDPGVEPAYVNGELDSFDYDSRHYTRNARDEWVGYYSEEYVKRAYLPRYQVLPFFIALFLLVLYMLGKFVVAGVGRMIVASFDGLIHRLPLVSNVYSSVKQVTDFVFTEREIEFNRVVAIEYPRKGIWSVGFVTGESMLDIHSAANEPVLSVLMPTSPMPMTGFTVTVLKSEAVDLNLTVDQAIQFVISCGVVIPPQQQLTLLNREDTAPAQTALPDSNGNNGQDRAGAEAESPRKISGPHE